MSHIPKKALIFYYPYSRPNNVDVSRIDQITSEGCSGQIALEKEPIDNQYSNQTILQLLGLFNAVDTKSEFKQRFNDMSLAIISNDPKTIHIANQLDCHYEDISLHLQIDRLSENVVFVDFTGYASQDAWLLMDTLLSNLEFTSDAIQCVISSSSCSNNNNNNTQSWWDSIRPRQSYLMKNGMPLKAVQDRTLVYSYLHTGSSRQDGVSAFIESDIKSKGSNSTILGWHLLAEIGHKLGFVPKYGA